MAPTMLPRGDLEIRIRHAREPQGIPVELSVMPARRFYTGHVDPSVLRWEPGPDRAVDGERLFNQLFADPRLRAGWEWTRGQYPSCRIRIRLDTPDEDDDDGLGLDAMPGNIPWESLREVKPDGTVTDLGASAGTPLARYQAPRREIGTPPQPETVKILVAVANPTDAAAHGFDPLDVDEELRFLRTALAGQPVELDVLDQPVTLQSVEEGIRRGCQIVHFIGHGLYVDQAGAMLLMADGTGAADFVDEERLAQMMARLANAAGDTAADALRLVVLAGCQTARQRAGRGYQGLGPRLLATGIPAVLAMQDALPVTTAQAFSRTFYRRLLHHGLVDVATNEARASLLTEQLPGAANPVLFMCSADGILWQTAPEARCRLALTRRHVQICRMLLPTPVAAGALLAAVVFAVLLMLVIPPTPDKPLPRMDGAFNIAVAEFGRNEPGGIVPVEEGKELAQAFTARLEQEIDQVATDFNVAVRGPAAIGPLSGSDLDDLDARAEQLAGDINAHLVIYGTITDDGDTTIEPRFYLTRTVAARAEETSGNHAFGTIEHEGALANLVVRTELEGDLEEQAHGLVNFIVGLAYFVLNRYEEAEYYFLQAEQYPDWDADQGKSVLYLFMGTTAARLDKPADAERYYAQALADDPGYARAQLALAQTAYLAGRDGCEAGKVDVARIEAALAGYDKARDASHLPALAEIPLKTKLFSARARLCLAIAGELDGWEEIGDDLTTVIADYETASLHRQDRIRYYASEAWNDMALLLLFAPGGDHGPPALSNCADQAKCREAIDAFSRAGELSRQFDRKATFSIWRAQVHLWLEECGPAEEALTQAAAYGERYLAGNPSGADALPDAFRRTIDERWQTQCAGPSGGQT